VEIYIRAFLGFSRIFFVFFLSSLGKSLRGNLHPCFSRIFAYFLRVFLASLGKSLRGNLHLGFSRIFGYFFRVFSFLFG